MTNRETPHPLGDLAAMIASALTGHYQGRWPDGPTLESFLRRVLGRSPVLDELAHLPGIVPDDEREEARVREALRYDGSVEAAAVRLGWRPRAVRLAVTRYGIDWPPACPRTAAGPCCDKGLHHEGACQDPDPAESERRLDDALLRNARRYPAPESAAYCQARERFLADVFGRPPLNPSAWREGDEPSPRWLAGTVVEARLQLPAAPGREAVDCVVATCEIVVSAPHRHPPATRWVAGPVSGATADDLYHVGERTLVHDARGRAIRILAVGDDRAAALRHARERLSAEGPAAPAIRWDRDERVEAQPLPAMPGHEALRAIRAEMEALRPGSTRDWPRPRPIRGVEQPPGPGFEYDAGDGRVGYVTLAGDGRGAVELVEGSWLPAAGAISDSAGAVPEGEAPRVTAARLLNASMIELVASRSPSTPAPQGEGSIWDMPAEPPDPAAELRPDPEVALTFDDPPGVEFWADEGDAVVRYALRWSPDDPVWGWTLESRGEDCDEFRTITDVSERFSQVWLTLEDFKADEEPHHVDRLVEAVARAAGVDLTAAVAAQERERQVAGSDDDGYDQEQDPAVTARDEDFESLSDDDDGPLSVELEGDEGNDGG